MSELVKRYRREEITVWASVNSNILSKCRKTVSEIFVPAHCADVAKKLSREPYVSVAICSSQCLLVSPHPEWSHAVQFFLIPGCAPASPLLQRPAALCAAGREFTAVLPAAHHEQVARVTFCHDQQPLGRGSSFIACGVIFAPFLMCCLSLCAGRLFPRRTF